jgi:hemolysin activation/secretion protein
MMSLGNRYTVRGFDGEYTLMGESGWYWRNEVSSHLAQWNSDIYTGIDIGAVYGPNTADLAGRAIVGAVIGLRGNFLSGLSYDVFAGIPLYKPDGYHTEHVTSGFTASWRF